MRSDLICKMVQGVAGGFAALGVLASPASAGGNWSGVYAGVSAGWLGSNIGWTYHDPAGGVADRVLLDQDEDAGTIGAHLGYQDQYGQIVLGAEVAFNGALGDSFGSTSCFNPAFNCEARVDNYFTAGGRLGYVFNPQILLYGSGGYANASIETQERNVATGVVNQFSTSERQDGWYIGGGIDYAVVPGVAIGIDYKHLEFDTETQLSTNAFEHRNINADSDAVTARLTFSSGGP